MMRIHTLLVISLSLVALAGCGTFSALRPADNLHAGDVEVTGGVSINALPEFIPVVRGTVGVTDWLEVGAQYEIYNLLGEARVGLLSTESHGIAIAVGATGGLISHVTERFDVTTFTATHSRRFGFGPTVTIGRRFDKVEGYLAGKALAHPKLFDTPVILAGRAGARVHLQKHFFLGAEGGATLHFYAHTRVTVAEATLSAGFSL